MTVILTNLMNHIDRFIMGLFVFLMLSFSIYQERLHSQTIITLRVCYADWLNYSFSKYHIMQAYVQLGL